MKNILLPISIVVLAVSVALGSFFIAGAMKKEPRATETASTTILIGSNMFFNTSTLLNF